MAGLEVAQSGGVQLGPSAAHDHEIGQVVRRVVVDTGENQLDPTADEQPAHGQGAGQVVRVVVEKTGKTQLGLPADLQPAHNHRGLWQKRLAGFSMDPKLMTNLLMFMEQAR